MFKIQSIALTAALFGYATATGCYPAYSPGGAYKMNDNVSYFYTEDVITDCPIVVPATAGCVAGKRTTPTTRSYNYECISDAWCGNSGYGPGSATVDSYISLAWTKEGSECTVSLICIDCN